MTAVIVVLFVIAALLNVLALRKIELSSLTFLDGIVIGMVFYLTIPMVFILIYGRNGDYFNIVEVYRPYVHLTTTFIILGFIAAMSLVRLALPKREAAAVNYANLQRISLWIIFGYFATAIPTFLLSGVLSGGHWSEAVGEVMSNNYAFLLSKFVQNFCRTAAFACIAALANFDPRRRLLVLGVGALICVVDVFTTFNRITIAYFAICLIIIYRRNIFASLSVISAVVIGGIYVSPAFTTFRSLVSIYGYDLNGFSRAWNVALSLEGDKKAFIDKTNGIFESMSIDMLNYVVRHYDQVSQGFGAYLLRPLTIFVPADLFPDRPIVFGLVLGDAIIGKSSVSLSSTILGEPYANSWLLWPVLIGVMIVVYGAFYGWLSGTSKIFGDIGAFVAIGLWRFDSSFGAICAVFCLAIYLIVRIAPERGPALRPPAGFPPAGDAAAADRLAPPGATWRESRSRR